VTGPPANDSRNHGRADLGLMSASAPKLRSRNASKQKAFSSEVGTGSRKENASKQEIQSLRSDSIGTAKALALRVHEHSPKRTIFDQMADCFSSRRQRKDSADRRL
jgi:hypothetical protein